MTAAQDDAREHALAVLARVLGRPVQGVRDDTPLATAGADAVALLLWADEVEAAGGAPVDAAGLAAAATFADLAALVSATMATQEPDPARAPGSKESPG